MKKRAVTLLLCLLLVVLSLLRGFAASAASITRRPTPTLTCPARRPS